MHDMIKLTIDDKKTEVEDGTTVLEAAELLGIDIPRFCHHPRLSAVGSCRMCVVEIEGRDELAISCDEACQEGMVVKTSTEKVKGARSDVLELLLINHPIDCTICDKAGECDLLDFYFEHSLRPSRFAEDKNKKAKAKRIGPHIFLDAQRCINCTRCVRFCDEVVGHHEIGLYGRGDRAAIDVLPGEELCNPYSLCTVDLCPVGALTSVDFRFKKRAWMLSSTPSICLGCATGCSIWIDHSDGVVYRLRPRENEEINESWMCDAGRFTYRAINAADRVLKPLMLKGSDTLPVRWEDALSAVADLVQNEKADEVIAVLSARASMEENAAFAALAREVFEAKQLMWSGEKPEPEFADDLLRCADRNCNAAGASRLAEKSFEASRPGLAWLILDGLEKDELVDLMQARPAWVVLLAPNYPPSSKWADVLFPKASYAEQEGSFVNRAGIVQRAHRAFKPLGESAPTWEIAKRIAAALGRPWRVADAEPSA